MSIGCEKMICADGQDRCQTKFPCLVEAKVSFEGSVSDEYLYNLTSNQQAIRDFIDITRYREGNLPPTVNVHPDRPGPIVRVDAEGERELVMSTWGMPTPDVHLDGKPDRGVTNVRKTFIPHWQQWLGVANRCLVPATAFSEYEQESDAETGKKPLRWFVVNEDQPVFALAGMHTKWIGSTRADQGTPGR